MCRLAVSRGKIPPFRRLQKRSFSNQDWRLKSRQEKRSQSRVIIQKKQARLDGGQTADYADVCSKEPKP
jgi:hypothetical protein